MVSMKNLAGRRSVSGTHRYKLYNMVTYTWWTFQVKRLFSRVHSGYYYSWKTCLHSTITFHAGMESHGGWIAPPQIPYKIILQHYSDQNLHFALDYFSIRARSKLLIKLTQVSRNKIESNGLYFGSLCGIGYFFELWNNNQYNFEW